jgi:hypothetical protein
MRGPTDLGAIPTSEFDLQGEGSNSFAADPPTPWLCDRDAETSS